MDNLNFHEMYEKLFSRFDLGPLGTELMARVIAGSERADDYENICKRDKFFTATICREASRQMKASVVSSLSHGVVVVGQQKVRNFVLGHLVARLFAKDADDKFQDMAASEKNVKYALKAEETVRRCQGDYTGLGFASGIIFDIFSNWIDSDPGLSEKFRGLFEGLWRHSLTTAIVAWSLASHDRVLISHRKIIFSAGLLHDVGQLGLAVFTPEKYFQCLEVMQERRHQYPTDDMYKAEAEREFFDLNHAEVGSALAFFTGYLRDVEAELDFHHDGVLLQMRSADSFLGAAILSIADRLAWLGEQRPQFTVSDVEEILHGHSSSFPLGAADVMNLFAGIRAKGLLNT